jgi:hypothetical protein
MKTLNLIKIASVVLLGIALINGPVQASGDKYSRSSHPAYGQLTHTVKLYGDDIRNVQILLSQSDAVHISWNNNELKFALREGAIPEYTIRFEAIHDEPVEDWMFESDYLSEEPDSSVEPWMAERTYLDEQARPVESWMLSDTHLTGSDDEPVLEPWMFQANYLTK